MLEMDSTPSKTFGASQILEYVTWILENFGRIFSKSCRKNSRIPTQNVEFLVYAIAMCRFIKKVIYLILH